MIRIPTQSDIDIQNAFFDVQQELERLRQSIDRIDTSGTDTTSLENAAELAQEKLNKLEFFSEIEEPPGVKKSGMPLRVLHQDGTWREIADGLISAVPSGTGGASTDQRVVNVRGSVAIAPGGLSTDSVHARTIDVNSIDADDVVITDDLNVTDTVTINEAAGGASASLVLDAGVSTATDLTITANNSSDDAQFYIINAASGGLRLGTDNTVRWFIDANGVLTPAADDTHDLGSTTYGVSHIFGSSGAKGDPPYAFKADADTGFFLNAANDMRVVSGGVDHGKLVAERHGFDGYLNTTQSITNAAWNTVVYQGELEDFDGVFDSTGTGIFSPNENGLYLLAGSVVFSANTTGQRYIRILKDTTVVMACNSTDAQSAGDNYLSCACVAYLNSASYSNFRLQVYQNSGGALNITLGRFGGKKLSWGSTKT